MQDRVAQLEAKVAYLTEHLSGLEQRLAGMEGRVPATPAPQAQAESLAAMVGLEPTPVHQSLGLVGRTLVVLGGAYALRALTGSHVLPAQVGVLLGLFYGAPWLFLASRAAASGSQLDAFTHALTTALIGYPLVWEATLRFGALSPAQSAALLGALTAAALVLAAYRSLQGLAWVVTFGALASAGGLAIATTDWAAYTVLAIAVGLGTLWLGYVKGWTFLRWPAAGAANIMMLVVTGRAAVSGQVGAALAVQMLMLAGYLGSFAVRTLFIGREVIPFEVAQSVAVLAVAFGGAIALIRSTGSNVVIVGLASLVLAVAGYVVAFVFVERHRHVKNFFFYTLLAQLFAIVGISLVAGEAIGAVVFAVVAVAAAAFARRSGRLTVALQAIVYAVSAVTASHLAADATFALLLPPSAWGAPPIVALLALAAVVSVAVLPVRRPVEHWGVFANLPRLALIAALLWTAAGVAVAVLALLLPERVHADGSILATLRTAILVLAIFALARAARHESGREAGWLVYPLLVVTGLKLVFVDFPQGRPETLFAALALYGLALIAAPRMLRRPEVAAPAPAAAAPMPIAATESTEPVAAQR